MVVKEGDGGEREKACPSAQQVLADGPDSGLWTGCFSAEMRCWGGKKSEEASQPPPSSKTLHHR